MLNILWAATSNNSKTGNVPTAWVGPTREEARASCAGCPLLDKGCYAHSGTPLVALASIRRAATRGKNYTLKAALKGARRSARMVRYTAIGDGGRVPIPVADGIVSAVKAAGLDLVGYTHHWREQPVADAWRGRLMASCDNVTEADTALAAGWRVAVVLPANSGDTVTPGGRTVKVCPAIKTDGRITCNDCRLCDGSKRGPVIGFPAHGNQTKAADIGAAV
jgi:hypothetical protein